MEDESLKESEGQASRVPLQRLVRCDGGRTTGQAS